MPHKREMEAIVAGLMPQLGARAGRALRVQHRRAGLLLPPHAAGAAASCVGERQLTRAWLRRDRRPHRRVLARRHGAHRRRSRRGDARQEARDEARRSLGALALLRPAARRCASCGVRRATAAGRRRSAAPRSARWRRRPGSRIRSRRARRRRRAGLRPAAARSRRRRRRNRALAAAGVRTADRAPARARGARPAAAEHHGAGRLHLVQRRAQHSADSAAGRAATARRAVRGRAQRQRRGHDQRAVRAAARSLRRAAPDARRGAGRLSRRSGAALGDRARAGRRGDPRLLRPPRRRAAARGHRADRRARTRRSTPTPISAFAPAG